MVPIFEIGDHEYTKFVESIKPVDEDLDADGSGRDITTGIMYRTRIATKQQYTVSMMRMWEDDMAALAQDLDSTYITCTFLNPRTNAVESSEYYISEKAYGTQRYDRSKRQTYYDDASFKITER